MQGLLCFFSSFSLKRLSGFQGAGSWQYDKPKSLATESEPFLLLAVYRCRVLNRAGCGERPILEYKIRRIPSHYTRVRRFGSGIGLFSSVKSVCIEIYSQQPRVFECVGEYTEGSIIYLVRAQLIWRSCVQRWDEHWPGFADPDCVLQVYWLPVIVLTLGQYVGLRLGGGFRLPLDSFVLKGAESNGHIEICALLVRPRVMISVENRL